MIIIKSNRKLSLLFILFIFLSIYPSAGSCLDIPDRHHLTAEELLQELGDEFKEIPEEDIKKINLALPSITKDNYKKRKTNEHTWMLLLCNQSKYEEFKNLIKKSSPNQILDESYKPEHAKYVQEIRKEIINKFFNT